MSKLIYIIIAVVVFGGGFLLVKKSYAPTITITGSKTSQPAPQSEAVALDGKTIVFSGTSFSSSSLEIKVGDTVKFVNQSSSGMWVASAPHPTHTDYPEFDAKKVYNPGETYTFTFTKVGSWKYHNHLNPASFGTVVVNR